MKSSTESIILATLAALYFILSLGIHASSGNWVDITTPGKVLIVLCLILSIIHIILGLISLAKDNIG